MAKVLALDKKSRFTDVDDEPMHNLLVPIKGYQDKPLVSLVEAIQPVSAFFNEIEDNVQVALHNSQNPADGLTQQESASVHLYTMEFGSGESLYTLLNRSLRAEKREDLKPWFLYLKLFLTALHKLPSQSKRVWRGIKGVDLSSKYKTGTKFAWWGVSSCTTDMKLLESDQFLGKSGLRTMFSIDCSNGKSVIAHSYFTTTEQEIILMPGSYFEVIGQVNPAPDLHSIELKEITPSMALVKPPFSQVSEQKASSTASKPNASFSSTSTNIINKKASGNLSENESPILAGISG
ncbi:unnamed protein product [Adineta steineri]|uniref:NAD(P)(+)--arginine ADP-ribosyltransferase n=1 Tax=Adineta steineri TaxID=433720 RepID=A0A814TR20_9BILA|nr:unnamed protein product [Adineta steineri]CAF1472811.1 unnamed protein product [Adineta steineri]CAF3996349.1 unnamed protein product [Adineta steineri]CAF4113668.1 unnamed protein product [Adineta steineri]